MEETFPIGLVGDILKVNHDISKFDFDHHFTQRLDNMLSSDHLRSFPAHLWHKFILFLHHPSTSLIVISWATYGEMTYADVIASCMFNDTFSDDESMVMCGGSDTTDEPEPIPFWDAHLHDHVFPVMVNHDGGESRYYLPLNGDVHQFLEDYFDMIADEYDMEDYYVSCGNQEWHLYDDPACWANLNITPNMTIYLLMEDVCLEILVKVNNGSEEKEFWVSVRDDEPLDDLVDMVMNITPIDLGDHFKIYVDGFIKNDYREVLRSVFWAMEDYVITFVKSHVDETSSSESEVETEEDDVIVNYVSYEGLAYPFDNVKYPLMKSHTLEDTTVMQFIDDFVLYLKRNYQGYENVFPMNFEIEADGYQIDRFEPFEKQLHNIEAYNNIRMVYHPDFEVQLVMNGSRERKKIMVSTNSKFNHLCWIGHFEFDRPIYDLKFRYRGQDVGGDVPLKKLFNFNCEYADYYALYEIEVDVRQSGGMPSGVIKGHLKHKDAVKNLVKKAVGFIQNRQGLNTSDAGGTSCPQPLVGAMRPILDRLEDVKQKLGRDEAMIKPSVELLTDDQLQRLTEVFSERGCTEDKLFASANIILQNDLAFLDRTISFCQETKMDLIKEFITSYGNEFNITRGGAVQFDCKAFDKILADTIAYRRGIRRQIEASNAGESNPPLQEDVSNRCHVM